MCGDFNDEPGSKCYAAMTSGRFASAYNQAYGAEPAFTTFKDYVDGLKKRTIDYVSLFIFVCLVSSANSYLFY